MCPLGFLPITVWPSGCRILLQGQHFIPITDVGRGDAQKIALLLQAVKPVMGKYYREPAKSPGPIPVHLLEPLVRSFKQDHYVEDKGDIVFYKQDPSLAK